MDLRRILPIAVIGIALFSLVAYWALKPADTSVIVPSGSQAGVAGQTDGQLGDTTQPQTPATTAVTLPNKPVSSKEPATLVPNGVDLKQYCDKYYVAWQKSDWETAYELQPLTKKNGNDANGLAQQLQGYGQLRSYTLGEPEISDNTGMVDANIDLGENGIWKTTWTFVKNDKGQWTVYDSKTGMIQ